MNLLARLNALNASAKRSASGVATVLSSAAFWVVALPFMGVACITAGSWILMGTGPGLMVLGVFMILGGMMVARAMRAN